MLIGMRYAQASTIRAGDLVSFFSYLTIATGIVTKLYNRSRQMAQLPKLINRIVSLVDHVEKDDGVPLGTWDTIRARGLTYRYTKDGSTIEYGDFDIARNNLVEIRGEIDRGSREICELAGYYRARNIPVIFWNKEVILK